MENFESLPGEDWYPVAVNPQFWVSTLGRLYSLKAEKILSDNPTSDGYIEDWLGRNPPERRHRLQIEPLVACGEVHHISEIKTDNSLDNLAILTPLGHKKLHKIMRENKKLKELIAKYEELVNLEE